VDDIKRRQQHIRRLAPLMQWGWKTKGIEALMLVFAAFLTPLEKIKYLPIYERPDSGISAAAWKEEAPISYNISFDTKFEV
jgi:hypothetical protein